jgi:hypothetical protein
VKTQTPSMGMTDAQDIEPTMYVQTKQTKNNKSKKTLSSLLVSPTQHLLLSVSLFVFSNY